MPGDANLLLCNGAATWSYANIVTSTYGAPTSTTRNAGGFVVIDLLQALGGPNKGLSVILTLPDGDTPGDTDALTAVVQQCASAAFGSAVSNLADFDIAAATSGVILGSEAPNQVIRRISPTMRYLRLYAVVTTGDDFGLCTCEIRPWGYNKI